MGDMIHRSLEDLYKSKKVKKIIEWKENPKKYLEDFSNEDINNDKLALAIKEQIEAERK